MINDLMIIIVTITALGILSQWIAWRFRLPSIVIMSLVGLVIGPLLGLFNPQQSFGEVFHPLISLAVAIVLFEGSLSLDFREIKEIRQSIFRISILGALISWVLGSLAAYLFTGLPLDVAFVVGGLFIVTGPTVLMPLLRQAKMKERPATILKWEAVVVDPLGAMIALIVLEIILWINAKIDGISLLLFFGASILSVIIGVGVGYILGRLLEKGMIPEFLKSPVVLVNVLLVFVLSDTNIHETGILAVTAMGVVMANMQLTSLRDVLHFKENISILMISSVFIMLTASLSLDTIRAVLNWQMVIFVLIMLFIVRPISVFISTFGVNLTKQERLMIGWIAPRGIVALTVSGYFATVLNKQGFENTDLITALTLALVFATVLIHGFSISWLVKKLHLRTSDETGVIIIGGSPFSAVLGEVIQSFNRPVMIVDRSWGALSFARQLGLKSHIGDLLSEHTVYQVDLTPYEMLIAATEDDAYNALICQRFVPEFGRENLFQTDGNPENPCNYSKSIGGKKLFEQDYDLSKLNRLIQEGYLIRKTQLTEQYSWNDYLKDAASHKTLPLFAVTKDHQLLFITQCQKREFDKGTIIVSLTSPTRMMEKALEKLGHSDSPTKD